MHVPKHVVPSQKLPGGCIVHLFGSMGNLDLCRTLGNRTMFESPLKYHSATVPQIDVLALMLKV